MRRVALAILCALATTAHAQPITTGGLQKVNHKVEFTGTGTNASPLGLITTCSSGQVLAFVGSVWGCTTVGSILGSGTTNTMAKWTSGTAIGNSSVTDDGTTLSINAGKFTVTEANGNTLIAGQIDASNMITPTAFSGTRVDDYNPAGLSSAFVIAQDASSATTLTGITAQPDGTLLVLRNISATNNITLSNASAFSTAANRFVLIGAATWVMVPGSAYLFRYSGSRWNQITVGTTDFPTANIDGTLFVQNATYINGNELDGGYNSNFASTNYINYSGYLGGTTQFRDECISNGKNASGASCIAFFQGSSSRVGLGTASPAKTLDVIGSIQASVNINTTAGTLTVGNTSKFTADPTNTKAIFSGMPVGFGNQGAPLSPVDIVQSVTASTSEQAMAVTSITSGATFDTTAAARRAYSNFYDGSPTISSGTNILTGIQMRLDENQGGHATAGGTIHPVALWIDEGETWIGEHLVYVVRPGHLAVPTVSACGATPNGSSDGNDAGGRITVGGGAPTACTLAFTIPYVNSLNVAKAPTCNFESENGIAISWTHTGPGQSVALTWTGAVSFINYHCAGTDNNLIGP